MPISIILIVCIGAGVLAGLSTGFAGLSAAVFITPFLVSFLGEDYYQAVAIALASDVIASAVSSIIYKKNNNLDLKNAIPLFISILFGAIGGSVVSYLVVFGGFKSVETGVGNEIMTYFMMAGEIVMGICFIVSHPINKLIKAHHQAKGRHLDDVDVEDEQTVKSIEIKKPIWRTILSIVFGLFIGFISGFEGAGGGMLILLALTVLLKFDFKKAIGTSVLIMTFTALIGSLSHYVIMIQTSNINDVVGVISWRDLLLCAVSTTAFAIVGALIANKVKPTTLKVITGIMILISSIATLLFKLIH